MVGDIRDVINKIENSQLGIQWQDIEEIDNIQENSQLKNITTKLSIPSDNMIKMNQPHTSLKLFQSKITATHSNNCVYLEGPEDECQRIIPKTY